MKGARQGAYMRVMGVIGLEPPGRRSDPLAADGYHAINQAERLCPVGRPQAGS